MRPFVLRSASQPLALALFACAGLIAAAIALWPGSPVAASASKQNPHGSVIDFTPDGTQPGLTSAMEPPTACFSCHRSFAPGSNANDFMPHNSWGGSMMAHAARDPLFWAALDVANADLPGVGDYCLRCHTPTGWLEGRVAKTTEGGRIAGEDGCQLTGNHTSFESKGNDYAGITCHFCHRLNETGPMGQQSPLENGNFWIDDSTSCETDEGTYGGPCRKGPYQYAPGDPLTPPHGWEYSAFLDHGDMCGTCHDVSTPFTSQGPLKTLILLDGTDTGIPMPIERTFTEWKGSDFRNVIFRDGLGDGVQSTPALVRGQTCQDCHMAKTEDPMAQACSNNPEGSRAGNLPVHEFVGANTWIPAIIRGEYGPGLSGIEDRVDDLTRTIERAKLMLTQRSAAIEVSVAAPTVGSSSLQASVKVVNLTGHKLPTGYVEGRRMWLHVLAQDGEGQTIWENGRWDPDTGALQQDAQTKVYESKKGIWNAESKTCETTDAKGRAQFHFVLNNCVVKDNRIPPLGFTGGTSLETRPVGYSYPETSPGSGVLVNHDLTHYSIPLPDGFSGEVNVTATLRFQISSDDYIRFLKNQADERGFLPENTLCEDGPGRPFTVGPQNKTRGQYVFDLWNDPKYGKSPPEPMVSASASAMVSPE